MLIELLPVLNLALVSTTLVFEYRRRFLSPTFFAGLWVLVIFVLVPGLWMFGFIDEPTSYSGRVHANVGSGVVHAVISLALLSFCATTVITGRGSPTLRSRPRIRPLKWHERRAAYLCLALGIVTVFAAMAVHGGPFAYLEQLGHIRTGRASNLDRFGAILMRLGYFAYLAALILLIDRFANRKRTPFLLSIPLFLIILSFGVLSGGRFFLFTLLIGVAVGWALCKRRMPWLMILPGLLLAVFLGGVGKALLYGNLGFDLSGIDSSIQFYLLQTAYELSFPFLNLVNLMLDGWPIRYGVDFLFWYMKYTRFWGFELQEFDNSTYFNTWLITGEWRSDVPPGLVAFSYLQAGAIGLVLVPVIFVCLTRVVERWMIHARTAFGLAAGSFLYMNFCGKFVFYSDLASLVEGLAPFGLALLGYWLLGRATWNRRRQTPLEYAVVSRSIWSTRRHVGS